MIWEVLAAVSFLAFCRQLWLLSQYKQYKSRRNLSGCEMGRQLLDQMGFPQVPVQPVSGLEMFKMGTDKRLLLENPIYSGQSLYAIAETARRVVLLSKIPGAVLPASWLVRLRLVLRLLTLPAWLFAGISFLTPKAASLRPAGFLILEMMLILGIYELSRDWEVSEEAFELLKKTDAFEPDELVKLKFLLSALRLGSLAEIFKVPFDMISGLIKK